MVSSLPLILLVSKPSSFFTKTQTGCKASLMKTPWNHKRTLLQQIQYPLTARHETKILTQYILLGVSYLLTPRCRVLLQKLTGLQLVKKFPAFHETRRFITALTSVCHLSLSWASPIQSIYPHPISWRSILILSTHLRLGLPSGLLPSGFPSKTLYAPSPHPYAPHAQPISFFSILSYSTIN